MPATARKLNVNPVSNLRQKMIAAVNIEYKSFNPYVEDKETHRAARLDFVSRILNLRRPCKSITDLSDKQLGLVLDELRLQNGQQASKTPESNTDLRFSQKSKNPVPEGGAEVVHLASEEQVFTINKLVSFIGWSEEHFREFLFKKCRRRSPRMLTFKKANGLTMILLNIAADKDLIASGAVRPISRAQIAEHIQIVKKKLQIDQKQGGLI